MTRVRVAYEDGTREVLDLPLGDPFARMDLVPAVADHGPVVSAVLADRVDMSDGSGFPSHTRLSRSVTR